MDVTRRSSVLWSETHDKQRLQKVYKQSKMNEKDAEEAAVAVMPKQDLVGLSENCLPHL